MWLPSKTRCWTFSAASAASRALPIAVALVTGCAALALGQTATPTPTATPVPTFAPDTCFAVPDSIDSLVTVDPETGAESVLGLTGAGSTIRGLAIPPVGNVLYGATAERLGSINPASGAFTQIGPFGTAVNGDLGPLELDNLVGLSFNSSSGALYGVQRTTLDLDTCFAVEGTGDTVVTIDRFLGNDTAVGATSDGIEAIALVGHMLYAASGDQLGVIDRDTGVFTPRSSTFGQGDPGPIDFDDVRSLTFNVVNRVMYASNREVGADDLLFIVTLATGAHTPLQFNASTADYATISGGSCVSPVDIEALAMNPDGTVLYGSDGDNLVTINAATGACNVIGPFGGVGPSVTITGMGFEDGGTLHGTDASNFYSINLATGEATFINALTEGTNYGALDCPIAVPDALFRIDPATGSYVPLAFEFEFSDYALIEGTTCGTEIDAIAYHLVEDILFGIDRTNDDLVEIDFVDGFCNNAFSLGLGVSDLVALTYSQSTNELLATNDTNLYVVNSDNAIATLHAPLSAGTDYEALECPVAGCPLVVRKRHTGIPYAGAELTYRLFWLNPCEGITFSNVVLTDVLPAGLELISASSTAATVQTNGNTVTLTDSFVPKSPALFATLRAKVTASAGAQVTNLLTLRDNFGRTFTSSDRIRVREARSRASLSLHSQSKSAPGKTVTYTGRYKGIDVNNSLILALPAGVSIVNIYPSAASVVGNVVTWSNLPAPVGGVRVRTRVSTTVAASTVFTATATLTDGAGTALESIRDTSITLLSTSPTLPTESVSIAIAAAKQATVGLVTTVRIQYRDVQGTATVVANLPAGLSPTQTTPAALISGNTLTWPDVKPGDGSLTVKALLASDAAPGSVLTIDATVNDSGSGSASASAQLTVRN